MTTSNNIARSGDAPADQFNVVEITPAMAAEWMARNHHNRALRERVAQVYAADIEAGDWQWTGETIKFAADGTLLDGQHRLRAIVIADRPVKMLVVHGLDMEAQRDVDRGVPRKFPDVLKLRNEENVVTLAAVVRRVHNWQLGHRRSFANIGDTTVAQLLRTLDQHPELREVAIEANRIASHSDLPASVVGVCLWAFDELDTGDSRHFFDRLVDGTGHTKGDPIYELRRTLAGTKEVRGERSQTYLAAITIKAWNAYRQGRTVGMYRWKPGGARPEAFPEPE